MIGVMLGMVVGGFVAQHWGWRVAMMVVGIPGLFFAAIFWWTVREPPRGLSDGRAVKPVRKSMLAAGAILWRIRSYRYIAIGAGLSAACLYGYSIWLPSLLARSYGMNTAQIGFILGPLLGGVGATSALISGYLCDRAIRRDLRWAVWIPAIASAVALPVAVLALTARLVAPLLVLYGANYFLIMFFSASTSSIIQSLVPFDMRATGVAWKMLMVNLVGLGLGPQALGALSSFLAPSAGDASLRLAMLWATPVFVLPTLFYCLAGRYLRADADAILMEADRRDAGNI
jgi:predicted MFS family arabinose efflux permease